MSAASGMCRVCGRHPEIEEPRFGYYLAINLLQIYSHGRHPVSLSQLYARSLNVTLMGKLRLQTAGNAARGRGPSREIVGK